MANNSKAKKQELAKKIKYAHPDKGDMRPGMPGSGKFGRRKAKGGGYEEYLEA